MILLWRTMHGADYYVSCMSRRTVAAKAVLVDGWKCRPEAGINLYGTPRPMDAAGAAKGVRFVTLCRRQVRDRAPFWTSPCGPAVPARPRISGHGRNKFDPRRSRQCHGQGAWRTPCTTRAHDNGLSVPQGGPRLLLRWQPRAAAAAQRASMQQRCAARPTTGNNPAARPRMPAATAARRPRRTARAGACMSARRARRAAKT